jgi:hypothetical protein
MNLSMKLGGYGNLSSIFFWVDSEISISIPYS